MNLLNFGGTPLRWQRFRYSETEKAQQALDLIRKANLSLEIQRRAEPGRPPALFLGAQDNIWNALTRMAEAFGLAFEPVARPVRALSGVWISGDLGDGLDTNADACVTPKGMFVRTQEKGRKDERNTGGAEIRLPATTLGLSAVPAAPGFVADREPDSLEPIWHVGRQGIGAPAGLLGDAEAQLGLLVPLASASLLNGTPTVVVDGTDGHLALSLRHVPEILRATGNGAIREMSLGRAGQFGFNPLVDVSGDEGDQTFARWKWFMRGVGIPDELIEQAFDNGVRSIPELQSFLDGDKRRVSAAHALRRVLEADQSVIGAWLSGNFDVSGHLRHGGHLLIEVPRPEGARLAALRGIIGLAMEANARLLSLGVRWPNTDDPALSWMNALCSDRRWQTTVIARSTPDQATRIAAWFESPVLGEYIRTLPIGTAVVNEGESWWTLNATPSPIG